MNRELFVIGLIVFVTSLFTRSVDPVVPLIADGMTVQVGTAALLSTAFALPYALVQPPLGALADMMSKTRLMSICLVLLVLSAFVSATAPNFTVLFVSRVVAGIASGGIFPTSLATAGDRIPVARRQVAISRLLAATMTGNLLGASIAGIVGDLAGWRAVFLVAGGLGVLVVIAAVIGFRNSPKERTTGFDLSTIGPNYRAIFRNPLAKICFGAVFIESLVVFGIFPHMAAIMQQAGETRASIAGIVLAGFGVGAVFYAFCVAWLLRSLGERKLMIGGGLMMAAFCLILTLRLPWPLEFLNFAMLGFGFYWLHGCIQVYATELAPQARGSSMALHSASFFLGQAAGPVVYGIGFAKIGMTPVLIAGAILVAGVGFVCSRWLRRPVAPAPAGTQ
jgi:predicted MFS family arabinose efflux permease